MSHGFLLTRDGTYTTIDHPNADDNGLVLGSWGTLVTNINNRGELVGSYSAGGRLRGFLRDRKGRFTPIDPPGAVATLVTDLNDHGDIVGDSSGLGADELISGADNDSFLLDKGVYRHIELPGATSTVVNAINNRGEIAGAYVDFRGSWHGLLRDRKGRYLSIDHPDQAGLGTALYSINDRGQATGAYQRALTPFEPVPQQRSARGAKGGGPLHHLGLFR